MIPARPSALPRRPRRRPLLAVLVLATVAVVATAAPALAGGSAATTVAKKPKPPVPTAQVEIPSIGHPAAPLPTDFFGLSFEADALATPQIDPAASNLATLLKAIGPGQLRFGGTTLDRDTMWLLPGHALPSWASVAIGTDDLQRLADLSAASGWRVTLGLNLRSDDPASAAAEAAAAQRILGSNLIGVTIGNEPEAFVAYGWRPSTWGIPDYQAEITSYVAAINAAAPGVAILGPDSNSTTFLAAFAAVAGTPGYPLTAHSYSLTACGPYLPSISDLLGGGVAYTTDKHVLADVAVGAAAGRTVRIDETNSIACGGLSDASDTHAGALWAADDLLRTAKDGAVGINFHGGVPGVCRDGITPWYAPICAPTPDALALGQYAPQPEWYALRLLQPMLGTGLLPVTQGSGHNVRSWATLGADTTLRVLVDDMQPSGSDIVRLRVPAQYGVASMAQVSGPSLDARGATVLNGSAAGTDGSIDSVPRVMSDAAGTLLFKVPSGSLTLVTLHQACTVPVLTGLPKVAAERALAANGCAAGKIVTHKAPNHRKAQYVVSAQQTKAGKVGKYRAKVSFVLVPKQASTKKATAPRR